MIYMKKYLLLLLAFLTFFSCKDEYADLPDGLYARMETSKGDIILSLNYRKTPVTVANFVSLAEGKNTFVQEKYRGHPFYNGLKFHRVIPNFMIQGGDPEGTGSGDTGYKFQNEITNLKHDKPGVLSMANSGPDTNSSQFFITHVPTPWLDGKHTVFGEVVGNGMETVNKIAQDDAIISVTIVRKGEAAKKFDAVKTFADYFRHAAQARKKQEALDAEKKKAYLEKYKPVLDARKAAFEQAKSVATKTATGLRYTITQKGSGKKPKNGEPLLIRYAGYFEDGTLFDTSIPEIAKASGTFDPARAAQNGYRDLEFQYGNRQGMIPGFIEGLDHVNIGDKALLFVPAHLGFGQAGSQGGVIPPNADLIFEIEVFSKTSH